MESKSRKLLFIFVTILFVLSPFMIHYQIFTSPVVRPAYKEKFVIKNRKVYVYFVYQFENKGYEIILSDEYYYKNKVNVVFNKKSPDKAILFSFSGLFLCKKMFFPIFLYITILALYITLNQIDKKIEKDLF